MYQANSISMSFLSKLFGAFSSDKQNIPLLPDIELNYIGLKGEATLKKMVSSRDYERMKFQALKIYNDADDRYANSNKASDLEKMYVAWKNFEACELMWYYHDQILALGFGNHLNKFYVALSHTQPFEFPESNSYHGYDTSAGISVPFKDFYEELSTNMLPVENHFVYDIIESIDDEGIADL